MSLERAKKELEIKKVQVAKDEMEFKILERMEDIKRLKENMENQSNRIEQLNKELEDLKE